MSELRDRMIVALDVPTASEARALVSQVGEAASFYKVGKQLFTAEGPQVVRDLVASGRRVFLDLKFHDIPNTVGSAVASAIGLGVSMLTVHASGGSKMLKAAAESARGSQTTVLAVTVLTSLNQQDLAEIGLNCTVEQQVLRLGRLAIDSGCGGLVASANEARQIRSQIGGDYALVTPGVRPTGTAVADQARVVTPREAFEAGATHIVVGRPVTAAADPALAARQILDEIATAEGAPHSRT